MEQLESGAVIISPPSALPSSLSQPCAGSAGEPWSRAAHRKRFEGSRGDPGVRIATSIKTENPQMQTRGNIALGLRQSLSKTQIPNRSIHFNVHLALLLRQVSNGFHNLCPIPAHPAPASCRAASQLERPSARLGCAAGSE